MVSQLQPTQAVQPTQVVPSIQSSVPISAPTQPVIPLTSPITDQPNPITLTTQQPELTTSKALSFSTIVTVINGVTKVFIHLISKFILMT